MRRKIRTAVPKPKNSEKEKYIMINIFSFARFLPIGYFNNSSTIGIIGGADGPTDIYVTGGGIAPSLIAIIAAFIAVIAVWFIISAAITVIVTLHMVNKYKTKKPQSSIYNYNGGTGSDYTGNNTNENFSPEDK